MHADITMNNDIAINIIGFETRYERDADGTLAEHDVVIYTPLGDGKTRLTRRVDRLSKVLPLEDCGDNISYIAAHRLWSVISEQYDHWKQNNELPEDGTPLAAWPGVTAAQARVLRDAGLRTVEDVAGASDIVMTKTGISNGVRLRDLAIKFLASEEDSQLAAKVATHEAEKQEMKQQIADLMALVEELSKEKKPPARQGKKKAEAA